MPRRTTVIEAEVTQEVIEEDELCFTCSNSMKNFNSWNQPITIHYENKDVKVHKTCAVICQVCDTNSLWTAETPRYNVFNKTTCHKCYDEIIENNPDTEWFDCDQCGTKEDDTHRYWSEARNENLCEPCYDIELRCDECNDRYHEDNGHECERNDSSPYVNSYSYKPNAIFHGDDKYFFGVELEVETKDNGDYRWGAEYCQDTMNERGYLKEDGSLTQGFEIVTHPHSLAAMQNDFPWNMLEELRKDGFRSWNTTTCGLHVHVSRTAFKSSTNQQRDTHQIKFMKLIYDNELQVKRLAGRTSSYASFDDKGNVIPKVKSGHQSNGRRSAVNIENIDTIEVRIFRGSLRKERVLSAVEFVHAAVEYTRNLKISDSDKSLSWVKFVGYISDKHKVYPNLFLVMNEIFDKDSNTPSEES